MVHPANLDAALGVFGDEHLNASFHGLANLEPETKLQVLLDLQEHDGESLAHRVEKAADASHLPASAVMAIFQNLQGRGLL